MRIGRAVGYILRLFIPLKICADLLDLAQDGSSYFSGLPTKVPNMGIWALLVVATVPFMAVLAFVFWEVKKYIMNGITHQVARRDFNLFLSIFGIGPKCVMCQRTYRTENVLLFWTGTAVEYAPQPCNCPMHFQCALDALDNVVAAEAARVAQGNQNGENRQEVLPANVEQPAAPGNQNPVVQNWIECPSCGEEVVVAQENFDPAPAAVPPEQANAHAIFSWEDFLTYWSLPLLAAIVYAVLAPPFTCPSTQLNTTDVTPIGLQPECRVTVSIPAEGLSVSFINESCVKSSTLTIYGKSFYSGIPSWTDSESPVADDGEFCELLPHQFRQLVPWMGKVWDFITNEPTPEEIQKKTKDIIFYHWDRSSMGYRKIDLNNLEALAKVWDTTLGLKLFIHGFKPSIFRPQSLEYLARANIINMAQQYLDDFNVVIVDWTVFSAGGDYFYSARSTLPAGQTVANFLLKLKELQLTRFEEVHLVGFSLGSHVAGVAGHFVQKAGGILSRITALDAARPCFIINGKPHHDLTRVVDQSDATFVDEIHCDEGGFGTDAILGHVTFFPNGGKDQPGCDDGWIPKVGCSHNQCTEMFAKSLKNGELACPCKSWEDFVQKRCECKAGDGYGNMMGEKCRYFVQSNLLSASITCTPQVASVPEQCWGAYNIGMNLASTSTHSVFNSSGGIECSSNQMRFQLALHKYMCRESYM